MWDFKENLSGKSCYESEIKKPIRGKVWISINTISPKTALQKSISFNKPSVDPFYKVFPSELIANTKEEAGTCIHLDFFIKARNDMFYSPGPLLAYDTGCKILLIIVGSHSYTTIIERTFSGDQPPKKIIGGQAPYGKFPIEKVKSFLREYPRAKKICPKCGKENELAGWTCLECGYKFNEEEMRQIESQIRKTELKQGLNLSIFKSVFFGFLSILFLITPFILLVLLRKIDLLFAGIIFFIGFTVVEVFIVKSFSAMIKRISYFIKELKKKPYFSLNGGNFPQ